MEYNFIRQFFKKLDERKERKEYERLYSLVLRNVIPAVKEIQGKGTLQAKK